MMEHFVFEAMKGITCLIGLVIAALWIGVHINRAR